MFPFKQYYELRVASLIKKNWLYFFSLEFGLIAHFQQNKFAVAVVPWTFDGKCKKINLVYKATVTLVSDQSQLTSYIGLPSETLKKERA